MSLTDTEFKSIFPFAAPREGQRELIEKIINLYTSGKKYVILCAPTGTGKSVIGYSIAKYFGRSYVLTSQKILQEQYHKDFNIPYVLGRSNYKCQKNSAMTCELGVCLNNPKCRCRKTLNGVSMITCPYQVAKAACFSANCSNMNYSYFLSVSFSLESNDVRDLIICDECHGLENELLNQCSVKINEKLLKFVGVDKIELPRSSQSDETKKAWLFNDLLENLKSEYLYLNTQIKNLSGMKVTREYKKISARYSILKRYVESVEILKELNEKGEAIIITQTDAGIEFKLLHANTLFNRFLGNMGKRFLFMSASILDPDTFIKELGIDKNLVEYIECDSIFPVENRLIHYAPVGHMTYRSKEETIPKMIKKIDDILKKNPNVKGIIHTVNYELAERIIQGLMFSDQSYRLIMPKASNRQAILDMFYSSDKPYVLISPSLTEGIDLKDDLSRLCIICKVPYLNLGDKWTVARMKENQRWYISSACMNLVQMTGRSIRSETDYAKTYILDAEFMKLAQQSMNIFPKWWQEAVVVD